MMRSLYSGISGLRNHQTRMDVLGNNIANVNTAGYKNARVIFQDIFSQNVSAGMANQGNIGGTNPKQIGLGIRLSSVDVIHTPAAFGRTDRPTDMMINGEGFFIAMQENAITGEQEYLYTRAGNFVIDSEGYLVTSHGYFVMGYTVDVEMGVVSFGEWDPGSPAVAAITMTANQFTVAAGAGPGDPPTITIPAAAFGAGQPAAPITLTIGTNTQLPANALGFTHPAVPLPATLLAGDTWPAADVTLRPAAAAVPAGYIRPPVFGLVPKAIPEVPETNPQAGLDRIRVVSPNYRPVSWALLEAAGANMDDLRALILTVEAAQNALTIAQTNLRADPGNPDLLAFVMQAQDAYFNAQNEVTAFMDAFDVQFPNEDMSLLGFSVAPNGDVSVIVANKGIVIGRIGVAMFSNPEGLEKAGSSLYRETASSGPVVVTEAYSEGAGQIDGGGLEMSNVDLADQFTDMIVTQRGFQANSRIITVSDTMLEELVNLKR